MGAGHPIGGHSIELRCRLNRSYILVIILLGEDKRGYNLKNPRWRCSRGVIRMQSGKRYASVGRAASRLLSEGSRQRALSARF